MCEEIELNTYESLRSRIDLELESLDLFMKNEIINVASVQVDEITKLVIDSLKILKSMDQDRVLCGLLKVKMNLPSMSSELRGDSIIDSLIVFKIQLQRFLKECEDVLATMSSSHVDVGFLTTLVLQINKLLAIQQVMIDGDVKNKLHTKIGYVMKFFHYVSTGLKKMNAPDHLLFALISSTYCLPRQQKDSRSVCYLSEHLVYLVSILEKFKMKMDEFIMQSLDLK